MAETKLLVPRAFSERKELHHWSFTGFDSLGSCKSAIRQLEEGHLTYASHLVDSMRRDDKVDGALSMRASLLPSLPLKFENGAGRSASRVTRIAEEKFETMLPDAELADLVAWGVMLGVGFGELVWTRTEKEWTPRLKVWHPWSFTYRRDDGAWYGMDSKGQFKVEPGNGQWVVFEPFGTSRSYMKGKVRNLYVPWLLRQWTLRDSGRYSEVYGTPIKKGYVPRDAAKDAVNRFNRDLSALGNETTITLPRGPDNKPGFDLELIEARGDGMSQFLALAENAGKFITIGLLGQNLTSDVSGGSYAAAKVHNSVRNDLMQSDADKLSDCINQQVLYPWTVFNFGDGTAAPKVCWETQPPEDKESIGKGMQTLGVGIKALQDIGAKVDVDKILEANGYPVLGPATIETESEDEKTEVEDEKEEKLSMAAQNLKPAIEGQVYTSSVAKEFSEEAAADIKNEVSKITDIILASKSYEDMKSKLTAVFGEMSPEQLADKLHKAIVLAELNGIESVYSEGAE